MEGTCWQGLVAVSAAATHCCRFERTIFGQAGSGEALWGGGNGGKKMAREEARRSEGTVARAQCVVRTARASCASAIALRES